MEINKKKIVSNFLKEGYQLDPNALEFFLKNPKKIDVFLKRVKESGAKTGRILSFDDIVEALGLQAPASEDNGQEIEIIKKYPIDRKKQKLDISGYISIYNKRYESMKKILLEKMSGLKVTSINKIQKQAKFSLIVMIREKNLNEGSLLVEDPTGNMRTYFEKEDLGDLKDFSTLLEDDIVGVVCEHSKDRVKIKKIVWPGIPLNRKIGRSEKEIKCLFLAADSIKKISSYANLLEWLEKTKFKKLYLFILGNISKEDTATVFDISTVTQTISIQNTSMLSLDDVKIFIITEKMFAEYLSLWPKNSEIEGMTNLLKRRGMVDLKEPLFFESAPDIIFTTTKTKPISSNHKGTTIIFTTKFSDTPVAWLVDLKNRETNELNFSTD